MTLILHLLKSLFGAFFKITFTSLITGAVLAGIVLVVAYQNNPAWPPSRLTEVAAGALGVLGAYAAGMTVLLREAVHAAFAVERGVIRGVEQEIESVEHEITGTKR